MKLHGARTGRDASELARSWLDRFERLLPEACKPPDRRKRTRERFTNYLASYFRVSFELDPEPATIRVSLDPDALCFCDLCTALVTASPLRTRRLRPVVERHADLLIDLHLGQLAQERGVPYDPGAVERRLEDRSFRIDAALATYGAELVRRCEGLPSGPEALALWRRFAWTAEGSPIRGFRLDADEIWQARRRVIEALDELGRA